MNTLLIMSLVLAINCAQIQDKDWDEFKFEFKKVFKSSKDEYKHYLTFNENKVQIKEHQQNYLDGKVSYSKGFNQFSDMTLEEAKKSSMGFGEYRTEYMKRGYFGGRTHVSDMTKPLPSEVDWRTKGVVTPVKDQDKCAACWAFSIIGALEGQNALVNKELISLSEQNLVDCTQNIGNFGCDGGWPWVAYGYILRFSVGVDTEESYPYEAVNQTCRFNSSNIGAKPTSFAVLRPGDEEELKEAVANVGPISVCIAVSLDFMSYSGGVFDDSNCTSSFESITHCVLAVGYGTDDRTGKDYWLVKNQWNTKWGEGGYGRMVRNKSNQCSIASMASYPTLYPMIS